ncbi:cell envelope integrity protein TolA [Azospirillum sp. TSO22-1]|uniref:cell envelope integrity protein TolA n=1 Tax=Azospirillum sp. TSO22-1 TaxID=716789 RepID=UPI000D60CC73|nr:cell envelope integrity protein TolA [Azospirillum sp. TSO22-1]PWC32153.1 hypothetical protein TSO221_31315 [Azospirillum sp. TSO22-1]
MRQPLIASVVLHVALIALVVLGLPPSDRKLDIPASIPIEIVDIGEVTEAARVVQGDNKPEPPKPPVPEAKPTPPAPPPPEPVSEPPPPPPPPKAPEPPKVAQLPPPPPREPEPPKREPPPPPPPPPDPTPQPVPKPPPPKVEPPKPEPPKPEPPKPEPPKPEPPKPEPPKPEPPKPEPPKPQPPKPEPPKPQPPKPAPEKADPLANLLKDVAKLKPSDQKSDAKPSPSSTQTASAQAAPSGPKNVAGPDRAFKPSGRAIDAIRGQVSKNWNFDPGRKDSSSMVVQLRIDVALDGTVIKADFEPETRARMGSDSHYRSAAEAALRAVLRTQKLDLLTSEFTPDTYDKWRTIVFTFDPRDMF